MDGHKLLKPSPSSNAEELLRRYAQGERGFHGINLCGTDLSGADLSEADLSSAHLGGVNLRGANLYGANLYGANLVEANLLSTYLNHANLSGAILFGTKIDETTEIDSKWRLVWEIINQGAREQNLSGTDLSFACLIGVDLSIADLCDANLSGSNLSSANLIGANLSGANLSNANLSDANLSGVSFFLAQLNGANLEMADLSKANLVKAELGNNFQSDYPVDPPDKVYTKNIACFRNANLSDAYLYKVNMRDVNLEGANLSRAFLYEVDFRNANLSEANLTKANLRKAQFNGANLEGANLSRSCLHRATLLRVKLERAKLKLANLSKADLSSANLCNSILVKADLCEANLCSANLSGANLEGARLCLTNLAYAKLNQASFRGADLSYANLAGTDLTNTKINGAKLNETILSQTQVCRIYKVDWTNSMWSLQGDFIHRLKSNHLLVCPTEGFHSELTVISGKKLQVMRSFCWEMVAKYRKEAPKQFFLNTMKGKLGEEVIKNCLGNLVTSVNYDLLPGGDGKVDFRLTSNSNVGIQVKAVHSNIDTARWSISAEEIEQNVALACILIREEITDDQSEFHLVLAGFLPTRMIKTRGNKVSVGIDQLLYGGGLRSYLQALDSHQC